MIYGQILIDSCVGNLIYELVKREDIKNIVEIGTWYGMGTTYCIRKSILDSNKKDFLVYSLESNVNMWKLAIENNQPSIENFNLLLGTIITKDDILDFNSIDKKHFINLPKDEKFKWYLEEITNCEITPNHFEILPEKIDLLILDGGEFSTYGEFMKLKNRFGYLIVDDTREIKGDKIREFILSDKNYNMIEDKVNDRNGFLFCERIIND
jgi:hypothetical protein